MSNLGLWLLALFAAWIFFSFLLLIHEYGHLLACERERVPVSRVQVGMLRLFTLKISGVPHEFGLLPILGAVHCELFRASSSQRARVAAAGPLASVLLGIFLLIAGAIIPAHGNINFVALAGEASLILALLNVIPLPPMDGYPILAHALQKRGIHLSPKIERRLLAAGLAAIAITTLLVL